MTKNGQPAKKQTEDLRTLISYQIRVLANMYTKAASSHYARTAGLTRTEWIMIAGVHVSRELSMKALAQQVMYDPGLTSRMAKSLIRRGLLRRRIDPKDTRSTLVSLSNAGREAVRKVFVLAKQKNEELLSCLTVDERDTLWRILKKLQRQAHFMTHIDTANVIPDDVYPHPSRANISPQDME